jgi:hypothetical protein
MALEHSRPKATQSDFTEDFLGKFRGDKKKWDTHLVPEVAHRPMTDQPGEG